MVEIPTNLVENIFLRSNHTNYQHILDGIQQIESGQTVAVADDEWEKLLHE